MAKANRLSRMFPEVKYKWNCVTGCTHNCIYCWARILAEKFQMRNIKKYKQGFELAYHPKEFEKRFKKGMVFAVTMGDLFCPGVPHNWILDAIEASKKSPNAEFLFLTKNPQRFNAFLQDFPENAILGATIESDMHHDGISRAQTNPDRIETMKHLSWGRKVISIEPAMFFDVERFCDDIRGIAPELVWYGLDNYDNHLPEPTLVQTNNLIQLLERYNITVSRKTIRKAWSE